MDKKNKFTVIDKNGKEVECEVLFTFDSEETGKNYIVYTDNTNDENGELNVYAAIYYPFDSNKLDPIETDEEWDEIDKRLKEL
jgi:uncharacterized protein YrzB (UPF0473 family)